MKSISTKRFVSLHGFFALSYPENWINETDEAGHYLFYNQNGGQGVLRVMVLANEFSGEEAEKLMYEEIYKQNNSFNPTMYASSNKKFIAYSKIHTINQQDFKGNYWAIVNQRKVVLFVLTQQHALADLPQSASEKETVEQIIASLEFLAE